MRLLPAVLLTLALSWSGSGQTYTISTFAGGELPVNILGASASLYGPQAVAADTAGNIFFVDQNDVLRLDATTGVLTVVAGNGTAGFSGDNGPATSAQLSFPEGVAVDSAGNLYIADQLNSRIRKVTNGVITTFAGGGSTSVIGYTGPATNAQLITPWGVGVDPAGNVYIAETELSLVLKVSNGVMSTVAGGSFGPGTGDNGPATSAELLYPQGVAADSAGNIYIADTDNNLIRKVANGIITTVAGNGTQGFSGDNGPATSAEISGPYGVAVDSSGNLYIADTGNFRIRKVSKGVITTVAGDGISGSSGDNGPATSAELAYPAGIAVDSSGNLYIADYINFFGFSTGLYSYGNRVRKVSNGVITTVAGNGAPGFSGDNGPATSAQLYGPSSVAVDAAGNVYIADTVSNHIRKVSNGVITTVAGNGTAGFSGDNGPATSAQLAFPVGVAVDPAGTNLYIADSINNRVRKVANGVITTVAGNGTAGFSGDNGPATGAELNTPQGVAVDSAGNLYIADARNFRVRMVANGTITTVAGNGTPGFGDASGPATSAELGQLYGLAVDSAGNLYMADSSGSRIREVSNGVISTVAGGAPNQGGSIGDNGPATSAELSFPEGIAVDTAGNLYIADTDNNRVRKVTKGVITTVAGGGTQYGDKGPGSAAELNQPGGVAVDTAGNVYIADTLNSRIRLLTPGTLPAIPDGGVVPNDGSVSTIQAGSWVSIYGTNLASGTFLWNGDFPLSLGGTSVTIDSKPAYLWFVSPFQINLQVADDTATGAVNVAVTTASGTATSTVTLAAYGPSFSLFGDGKHVAGEIATPNGTGAHGGGTYDLVGPSNTFSFNTRPVKAGETLILFGVGFGPTNPHVAAGQTFSGSAPTTSPVTVTIGNVQANVAFAGITEAGLYQINVTVPANTGSGDQALAATVNGVQTTPGAVVAVQ